MGKTVGWLLRFLIVPTIGNFLFVAFGNYTVAFAGYTIFMVGLDLSIFVLLQFTFEYCSFSWPNKALKIFVIALLAGDILLILSNPFTHAVFDLEPVLVDGYDYYTIVKHFGRSIHSITVFGIYTAILILFLIKVIRSPRIYAERYAVILAALALNYGWQLTYVFTHTVLDRTMFGFDIFGLLLYYFSLLYRPTRLIDRMLAAIASELPEALFFFDAGNKCVWVNKPGMSLLEINDNEFYKVPERLAEHFGPQKNENEDWVDHHISGSGDDIKSYVLEKHTMRDSKNHVIGSFLSVRDNTDDQKTLQNEMYKATHDILTDVYNRAGYELLLSNVEPASTSMLLIDIDNFKGVNDTYGHETGDRILRKVTDSIKSQFRSNDYICRIGGDEFIVFMVNTGEKHRLLIERKIARINELLAQTEDDLPVVSVSVGCAFGDKANDRQEWFNQADQALYETKRNGRKGLSFFRSQNSEFRSQDIGFGI